MLEFRNVFFSYENKPVLQDFSFTLRDKEILAVMGPSGCGKSTLLSLASGLLRPDKGFVISSFDRISFVFQEPRLFPWFTVKENLMTVLKKEENKERIIAEVLQTVELAECADLYPDELSGGMKSRVSIARALAFGGDLFLLDEPFSALDEDLRGRLSGKLRDFFKSHGAAGIFVTHHAPDAKALADRILYLSASTDT